MTSPSQPSTPDLKELLARVEEAKLTKAQLDLLAHVGRQASPKTGIWRLRDMRRARSALALEKAGLLNYGYPEPGPWPRTVRIDLSLTDDGRALLKALIAKEQDRG